MALRCPHPLPGGLQRAQDSLFSAYREFLTVIAGSPRAARASLGCLSKEEYVKGKGPDGKSLHLGSSHAAIAAPCQRARMFVCVSARHLAAYPELDI